MNFLLGLRGWQPAASEPESSNSVRRDQWCHHACVMILADRRRLFPRRCEGLNDAEILRGIRLGADDSGCENAEQAAVKSFQRCRERQAEIYAEPPPGTIRDAEAVEWQLADETRVNEAGFRGTDGETFDTFEIAAIGLGYSFARELSGSTHSSHFGGVS